MKLYIAEKPELARAIVEGLGGGTQKKGFYECANGDRVTWCYGHMLSLKDPEDYDPAYAKWSMDQLPMSFIPWSYKPNPSSEDQLNIIISLLEQSTSAVNAGDPDPEGSLLVDEILGYVGYTKPVNRVLINDNNLKPVQQALARQRCNTEFRGMSLAAEARSVGDQLYGYNLTRCYTIAANNEGFQGVLSLGRVQTPVLGIVVRRDLEHEAHVKSYYYTIAADFVFGDAPLQAKYIIAENDPVDDSGRITDPAFANDLSIRVTGHKAVIKSAKTTPKQERAPLPYNLLKLQTDASRKFGYKPDRVKDITQNLREKHRLITYNRSDCQYLGDNHHEAAPTVLSAIAKTAPMLSAAVGGANPKLKSKAFDASKVTAHHAIIPTETTADFSALTEEEQRIYMLIARAYVAQFFPAYEYDETEIVVESSGYLFSCTSRVGKKSGWKVLYKNDAGNEEVETEGDTLSVDLTALKSGAAGECKKCFHDKKETAPPKRYTIATLLTDLTRVAKYVRDPKLKALLVEKDKGKQGEHGGIGTPATRDTIIANLFERGYITEQGKSIVSTKIARELYAILPDEVKYPDMTAIWHEQQQAIESMNLSVPEFIDGLMMFVTKEVEKIKENGLKGLTIKKYLCPNCKKIMRRLNGTKGPFWACSGYVDGCKTSFEDKGGIPQMVKSVALPPSKIHKCNLCQSGLQRKKGSKAFFWGCSAYPKCEQSYPEILGKPDFNKPKVK